MAQFRRIFEIVLPYLAGGLIVAAWFLTFDEESPRWQALGSVQCGFAAERGQAPIRLGRYRAPLASLTMTGDLYSPFRETLYNFEGKAKYSIEGKSVSADVRGSVFLDDSGRLHGIIITLEDANFGRYGAKIVTLDEEGLLDYSRERAFVYTTKEFKLSHPLSMSCDIEGLRKTFPSSS